MTRRVDVGALEDVAPGTMLRVQVEGTDILLVNLEGSIRAMQGICSHEYFELDQGFLTGDSLTCALHLSRFDLDHRRGARPAGRAAAGDVPGHPRGRSDRPRAARGAHPRQRVGTSEPGRTQRRQPAWSSTPAPAAVAVARMALPKMTSARPTPRCDTSTRPSAGRVASGDDGLAERGSGVGVVGKGTARAIRLELAPLVDQEQGGFAGDRRRDHRRVIDGHHQRVWRQPVRRRDLAHGPERDRGDDDIRAGHGGLGAGRRLDLGDAGRPAGDLGEVRGAFRMPIMDRQRQSGEEVAEDRQVAAALHARTDKGGAHRSTDDAWREVPDGDAGDRGRALGGDRGAIEDADRKAGPRIVEQDQGGDRGQADGAVAGEADDPLHAQQVVRAGRIRSRQECRHGMGEGIRRARLDAQLGWQLRIARQRRHRHLGEPDALLDGGHGGLHLGRIEISDGRAGWHRRRVPLGSPCSRHAQVRFAA